MSAEPNYPLSYVPVDSTAPRSVGADYLPTAPETPAGPAPFVFPGTEDVNPAAVFSGPGYLSPTPPYSLAARLALVCAVLGVIPGVSLAAIGLGHYALYEIARSHRSGRGLATSALTLGYMGAVVWVLIGILSIVNG
ncbi:protein of unknown function [Ruaniaceae bacterium KH17]|nr:protein of unknown function [Ruaniaceae bacterium KH17]